MSTSIKFRAILSDEDLFFCILATDIKTKLPVRFKIPIGSVQRRVESKVNRIWFCIPSFTAQKLIKVDKICISARDFTDGAWVWQDYQLNINVSLYELAAGGTLSFSEFWIEVN